MTHITDSSYTEESPQADGRRWVHERHVDNLGRPLSFDYLADEGVNPATVIAARAERLNAEFAARDAEASQAAQGRIPWSKLEFRDQLGQATEVGMDAFFATFESNPALTAEQKAAIRTGFNRYKEAHYIERPLRAEVLSLLGLLKSLGLITQERIDLIVAASEA